MFRAFSRHVSSSLLILRCMVGIFVEGDVYNDKFYTMKFTLGECMV